MADDDTNDTDDGRRTDAGTSADGTLPIDDPIARALLAGSTFERVRFERFSHFRQSIPTKLGIQAGLLAALALTLPLYHLFPDTAAGHLPAVEPAVASPKVLLLGALGGVVEVATAAVLVTVALYRVRVGDVSEDRAHVLLNLEDVASYLGLITGTLTIGLTLAYFVLALGGGAAIEAYAAAMDGVNPFADSGIALTVTDVALSAFGASVVLVWLRQYVAFRLTCLRLRQSGVQG